MEHYPLGAYENLDQMMLLPEGLRKASARRRLLRLKPRLESA